ncbi:MAG: hypothetical protein DWQ34_00970 [Planctomycetota bacterium]|nr:MAG: hypothetical protein DWQ34_00970 [Planctomycetota bacterium]REK25317.1 MAG: hypothetical protein DWQ41_12285 [Planctomycetota bacterium]REK31804.1 MAG: hypothetical protein DWQ45_18570 [Planctomycetota bacterium]
MGAAKIVSATIVTTKIPAEFADIRQFVKTRPGLAEEGSFTTIGSPGCSERLDDERTANCLIIRID